MKGRLSAALIVAILGQSPARGGEDAPPVPAGAVATQPAPGEPRVDRLIIQLGDPAWRRRDAAQKQLVEIGRAALPALCQAMDSNDLEVSTRAALAAADIQKDMAADRGASGHPYLAPEQRPLAAKAALHPATSEKDRYQAVWGLAISGYTREGAEALAAIAADASRGDALRECAAMGLLNFTQAMPAEIRRAAQNKLRGALDVEKAGLQGGVIQTLAAWGDADLVREVMAGKLKGHPMEVIVLKQIASREIAVARLWEIYKASAPAKGGNIALSRAWHAGEALIHWRDKRGVDILLECLAAKPDGRSDDGSFRQSRHNTFMHLAAALHDKFGYDAAGTWTPQLDEAVAKMAGWWEANRSTWDFAPPAAQPKPQAERPQ